MGICLYCNSALLKSNRKYCSNKCQADYTYAAYIKKWLLGEEDGSRGKVTKNFSGHVVRYLYERYDSRCSLCGWNKVNKKLGKTPLEIDHIDGDHNNNKLSNLRLICPNCHSLTDTFRNLNYGNGRKWRKDKYIRVKL